MMIGVLTMYLSNIFQKGIVLHTINIHDQNNTITF
jgi:hypothetical protein